MASILNATTTSGLVTSADNSGSLQLQTNNGTTAVTINTSQRVGINTTSPVAPLDIQSDTGAAAINMRGRASGDISSVSFYNNANTTQQFYIQSRSTYSILNTTINGYMAFATNDTERMRITSDGDVLIGTTTSSGKFTVNQTDTGTRTISASSPASYAATVFRSDSAATSGTGWYHLYGSSSSGTVNNIFIYGNGNIQNANNSYGAISDIKLKENIVDATPKLDKLMQVKVRNYNLKGEYEQHKQIGVIAQELETVFPSLIEETQDRGENDELLGTTTKSVKYSVFVPILIKAIQELKAELDIVKAELNTLKNPPVEGVA